MDFLTAAANSDKPNVPGVSRVVETQAVIPRDAFDDPYNSARIRIPGAWRAAAAPPPAATMTAAAGVSSGMGGPLYGGRSDLY